MFLIHSFNLIFKAVTFCDGFGFKLLLVLLGYCCLEEDIPPTEKAVFQLYNKIQSRFREKLCHR